MITGTTCRTEPYSDGCECFCDEETAFPYLTVTVSGSEYHPIRHCSRPQNSQQRC
jgi:hypothetical protein